MIRGFNGKEPRIADSAFISEGAHVMGDVEIGDNCCVWAGAVIRADIRGMTIGRNTYVEDNVVVHYTEKIGDNVVMGHGAVVEANEIGHDVLIGDNATILAGCTIGHHSIIAAGSTVMQRTKIPPYSFVAGIPAKIKGEISEEQLKIIDETLTYLAPLVEEHRKNQAGWQET